MIRRSPNGETPRGKTARPVQIFRFNKNKAPLVAGHSNEADYLLIRLRRHVAISRHGTNIASQTIQQAAMVERSEIPDSTQRLSFGSVSEYLKIVRKMNAAVGTTRSARKR